MYLIDNVFLDGVDSFAAACAALPEGLRIGMRTIPSSLPRPSLLPLVINSVFAHVAPNTLPQHDGPDDEGEDDEDAGDESVNVYHGEARVSLNT
jgi:hypothetical protein